MNERNCGRLGKHTVTSCADRAAEVITEYSIPRAVCLAPDGNVTVEAPDDAILDEMVGVYTPDTGRMLLWRRIQEDLDFAVIQRRIKGGTNHKHRAAVTRKAA